MTLDDLRKIAEAATAGEWVVGEPYDVQGALQCRCEGKGPLVWEGQANINGEMMLTHVHEPSESRKEIFSGDTSIYTKTVPHAYVVALSTSEYCEISKEDAEFIATFNPAKVLELLDQIEMLEREHGEMTEVIEPQNEHIRELTKATYVQHARLAAVEKLHTPVDSPGCDDPQCCDLTPTCAECIGLWPCLTIKAIKGETND